MIIRVIPFSIAGVVPALNRVRIRARVPIPFTDRPKGNTQ